MKQNTEIAVFGGGCFWCTEAVFERLKGVMSVTSGYAGGEVANPTYEQVSSGRTGHAEVIRIEYDPKQLSFKTLLSVFFTTHDPTTLNQQGADIGSQYRSVILYTTEAQRREARKFMEELKLSGTFDSPLTTELEPLDKFYEAEEYHKQYYRNNPDKPYCRVVINPKLAKLRKQYAPLLKS